MLTTPDLIRTLAQHWFAAVGSDVTTVLPGASIDVTTLASWIEFWVRWVEVTAPRAASRDQMRGELGLHCFSRHAAETREAHHLASLCQQHLSHQVIPVLSPSEPAGPPLAHLRTGAFALVDLSRAELTGNGRPLQHLLITIPLTCEETASLS